MLHFPNNPFPGMNPWLEGFWGDAHTSLTTYSRDAIQQKLPVDLLARIVEYFRSNAEPQTLREIQIVDVKAGRRVITAIEFISPANKTELGRAQYQRKQMEFIAAGVNLVEIDLLRFGHWVVSTEESQYPPSCRDPYRICVRRSNPNSDREAYRVSYAFPLPSIRIPLRPGDEDVRLPLQTILNQAYENGRYGNDIDYSKPPEPPLEDSDAAWIFGWLKQRSDEAVEG